MCNEYKNLKFSIVKSCLKCNCSLSVFERDLFTQTLQKNNNGNIYMNVKCNNCQHEWRLYPLNK